MKFKRTAFFTACFFIGSSVVLLPSRAADVRMSEVTMIGDVNDSDSIEVADMVKLSQYLLSSDKTVSMNGDLNGDGIIDVFDMVLMRKMLIGEYIPEDYTKLVINEACASNKKSLKSSDGSSPDWFEIYNGSETDIHLGGYGISDGTKNMFKYTFPDDTIIKAGEYLVVLCDGDGKVTAGESEHIAPFNISAKKSETLYLTHPYNGTIDAVTIPAGMQTDITYGRSEDGKENFSMLSPTPGTPNCEAENLVYVTDPLFSADGGFYDNDFMLELSADNCEIFYTIDGSDPRTSDTAVVYTDSISVYDNTNDPNVWSAFEDITLMTYYHTPDFPIDKGIVVRAVAKDTGDNFSRVISNTYFVGKTTSYYQDMKVISLATDGNNLFDDDTGIYVVGTQYYDWKNSEKFNPSIGPRKASNPTNYNSHGDEWEVPGVVQVFENGKSAYSANVGIRINGNDSRGWAQKSFRLCARSEYGSSKLNYPFISNLMDVDGEKIDEFHKLLLHNGGNDIGQLYMRDAVLQSLCSNREAVGIAGYEPCVVFVNGEFWGFYNIRERMDEHYFESHYHVNKDNVTYIKNNETEGKEELANSFNEFCKWAMTADMTDDENYNKVCDTLVVESLMDLIAVETYLNNKDFAGSWRNNYQIWRTNTIEEKNPYGDGKWRFVLNDLEYCANIYSDEMVHQSYDLLNNMLDDSKMKYSFFSVFYNLLNNDSFRQEFESRYRDIIKNTFNTDRVAEVIDSYAVLSRDAIADTNERYSLYWDDTDNRGGLLWYDYDTELNSLKTFFYDRPAYAEQYLEALLAKYDDGQ